MPRVRCRTFNEFRTLIDFAEATELDLSPFSVSSIHRFTPWSNAQVRRHDTRLAFISWINKAIAGSRLLL